MIYTFGHSTLTHAQAAEVLDDIPVLLDIRSHPTSNHVPQWKKDDIDPDRIQAAYGWDPRLGGWSEYIDLDETYCSLAEAHGVEINEYLTGVFPKHRIGRKRTKTSGPLSPTWQNWGLYDYSWFMIQPAFYDGMESLALVEQINGSVAIMCAELLWWKCHRSMVADALAFRGNDVIHLQPRESRHDATDRLERYEPQILEIWKEWWR